MVLNYRRFSAPNSVSPRGLAAVASLPGADCRIGAVLDRAERIDLGVLRHDPDDRSRPRLFAPDFTTVWRAIARPFGAAGKCGRFLISTCVRIDALGRILCELWLG